MSVSVSYIKSWKLLVAKEANKTDLRLAIGSSTATTAELSNEGIAPMDILPRIYETLHCHIGNVMDFVNDENHLEAEEP